MSADARWSITNGRTTFDHGLAADVDDLPEALFDPYMPVLERLVWPAPLRDSALPVDPEVRP